jgi:periplasmic protein TonB
MSFTADMTESPGQNISRWAIAAALAFALHVASAAIVARHWQKEDAGDDIGSAISVELTALAADSPSFTPDVPPGPLMEEVVPTQQASKKSVPEVATETPQVEQSALARDPEVTLPMLKPHDEEEPSHKQDQEAMLERPSASAAPLAASILGAARLQLTWNKQLVAHLNRFKRYPKDARARAIQGEVSVTFTIDRAGQVVASRILRGSGSSSLDDEALAVLRRASPLPSPPALVAGATFDLTIPIKFKIR